VTQAFKAAKLAIPETIAAQVAGERAPTRVYALLSTSIREALTALADRCAASNV
jgi:hypothetical protein